MQHNPHPEIDLAASLDRDEDVEPPRVTEYVLPTSEPTTQHDESGGTRPRGTLRSSDLIHST